MTGQQLKTAALCPLQAVVQQTTAQWLANAKSAVKTEPAAWGPLTHSLPPDGATSTKTIARNHPQASSPWPTSAPPRRCNSKSLVSKAKHKHDRQGPLFDWKNANGSHHYATFWFCDRNKLSRRVYGQNCTHTKRLTRDMRTRHTSSKFQTDVLISI